MKVLLLYGLALFACQAAPAGGGLISPAARLSPAPAPGTIAGRVEFRSSNPGQPADPVSPAFVHVARGLEKGTYPLPEGPVVLDQVSFQFVPRVFGIRVGQTLKITSQDSTLHNVFCQPLNNPGFNESMYAGQEVQKTFTAPELMIPLQCNIHHSMRAYAGVLDHPFFAVCGSDGGFEIRGLAPGHYTLAAWEEYRGSRQIDVDLAAGRGTWVEISYK